jgi:lambda family phage portal protein
MILGVDGLPMASQPTVSPAALPPRGSLASGDRPRNRAALSGGSVTAYDAADPWNRDMAGWRPWLGSPDTENNPYRDVVVARIRDLVRNDGWASGAVTKLVDAVIGGYVRLRAAPDWRFLRQFAKGFDETWADEYATMVESRWRNYAEDAIGLWFDISRRMDFSSMTALAFRHRLVDGDEVAISHWEPERIGPGKAQYATCAQLVDPDRLSNPYLQPDMPNRRGGVDIDKYGAAIGYNFRRAHQADWFVPERAYTWERVERETPWGRPIVIHDFDSDRAATHRSVGGVLKPVLGRLRMLGHYDATELQSAVVNATLAAYIESPYDHSLIGDALESSVSGPQSREILAYQTGRDEFHGERPLQLNGARIPTLYPGEKINTINASRPGGNFKEFEAAVLRNISSAIAGLAAPQVSGDWTEVNYSSARAALLDAWKSMGRMRHRHTSRFCTPLYANWLEEDFERDELPLPAGAPDFIEARAAYAAARWMGPPRGWVDPLNERRGAVLGLDAGFSTLDQECAEQGLDWREVLQQRAREKREFERLGLPLPMWQSATDDAAQVAAAPTEK